MGFPNPADWIPSSLLSPTEWPPETFLAIGVLLLCAVAAYVWRRIGKGMLIALVALAAFVVVVIMNMRG